MRKTAALAVAVVIGGIFSGHAEGTHILRAWDSWSPDWMTMLLRLPQTLGGVLACDEIGGTPIASFSLLIRQDGQEYILFKTPAAGESLGRAIQIAVDQVLIGTFAVTSFDPAQSLVRATLKPADFNRLFKLFDVGGEAEIAVDRTPGTQATLTLSLEGFSKNVMDLRSCEMEMFAFKLPSNPKR
jgi:hypothetical protein